MRQSQQGRQPVLLAPPIERDVLPALGASNHRTNRDDEDVDELVIAPARLAWILQPCKARCQPFDHAARPRLHRTGNGQHIGQSTARPKFMREPWGRPVIEGLALSSLSRGSGYPYRWTGVGARGSSTEAARMAGCG